MSVKAKRSRFLKTSVSDTGVRIDRFFGVPSSNEAFVNRPNLIAKMEATLSKRSTSNERIVVALKGLGGMGKTQLMLQYCYLYRSAYEYIFWLNLRDRDTMIQSFRSLASNLGLNEGDAKGDAKGENLGEETLIGLVRGWLESKTKWLLLLDDIEEATAKELFTFLPRVEGDVILTTREHIPASKATPIQIDRMEQSEALLMLLGESVVGSLEPESPQLLCAQEIVANLDCIPLAVQLAKTYMDNEGISLQQYLGMFKNPKTRSLLLSYEDEDAIGYGYTLSSVWKLSLERLKERKPTAYQILKVCAFLEHKSIPVSLFERQYIILELAPLLDTLLPNDDESRMSGEAIQTSIAVLVKFHFLGRALEKPEGSAKDPANDMLSISRLFQLILYDDMGAEEKDLWAKNLATAINQEINFSDTFSPAARQIMDAYLPHIRRLVELVGNIDGKPFLSNDLCDLLTRTVQYITDNGPYADSEKFGKLSVSIAEIVYGSDHPNTATVLHNLAVLYHKEGKYEQAELVHQRAMAIREKALGQKHPDLVTSLNAMGSLYTNLGKYEIAEPLLERAMEICGDVLGPEHLSTALSLNSLALLYHKQDKYDMAEPLYQEALAIRERVLGHDHPVTAVTLNDLATLYDKQCKYEKAKPLHQRALGTREKMLKSEHPDTATSLNSLAFHYYNQSEYHVAEPLFRRALMIRERSLGPGHSDTAQSLSNLAAFYNSQGEYSKAEVLYKRVLTIREKSLGATHPSTVTSISNLASLYHNQGKFDMAETLFRQALETSKKSLGLEHPYTAAFLNNLAALYQKQGAYEKAEPLYEQALAIRKKLLGPEHPDTLNTRYRLLVVQKMQKSACIIA